MENLRKEQKIHKGVCKQCGAYKNICAYIIKDKTGLFKNGKTSDINGRIKALSVGNPFIELVYKIDKDVESELHRCFRNKNVSGEWFSLSEENISFIKKKYPNVLPI